MSQVIYVILLLCTTSEQGCTLDQDGIIVVISGYHRDHVTVCRLIDQRYADCQVGGTFSD
jgi:hypothetical protein